MTVVNMMTNVHNAPIALTMGDPGGCGPQITLEAWRRRNETGDAPFFVIADPDVLAAEAKKSGVAIRIISEPQEANSVFEHALPVIVEACPFIRPGDKDPRGAKATINAIARAVAFAKSGHAQAVVTNPINKALLQQEGFRHPGHTEFLAALAAQVFELDEEPKPVMLLTGGGLRVALATIHVALRDVVDQLDAAAIQDTALIVNNALKTDFNLSSPRIALAGLNPHAGEEGRMGREEIDLINPTAANLRQIGVNVSDAQPGDTVFAAMLDGQYDCVIAMYHDQGLAPLKTLDMWGGVNTTIGLPFVRTSPDHGTAYEAARTGTARPDSLIAAIKLANKMALSKQTNRA